MTSTPPPRIVIVEDDTGKRYTIARQLRAAGFEIREAATAEQGWLLIQDIPDLVILDIRLPDADGLEICRRAKSQPETASVLILALSARFTSAPDRARGLDHGADAYLVHPVDGDELIATVRALLRLRQAERDRTRLAAEIEASERRYRTITETTTVGLCLIDADMRCTFLNRAAEIMLRRSSADLRGQMLHGVLEPRSPDGVRIPPEDWLVNQVITGNEAVSAQREVVQRADGTSLMIELSANPIVVGDMRVGAVVEIKDIEDLVQAEKQRDLFLATLGHDLRAPLQTMSLGVSLLQQNHALGERERLTVQRMRASTTRMERLIAHILTFARTLVEGVPLALRPIDLAEICRQVVREASGREQTRLIDQRGLAELRGTWDADRLAQVVENLVSNALSHGVGPVTITLAREGDDAILSVHNLGPPIPRAALPTLFDPFRRATERAGGVGLGLYIVDQIVRAHSGSITIDSELERGTTMTIRVPLEPAVPGDELERVVV